MPRPKEGLAQQYEKQYRDNLYDQDSRRLCVFMMHRPFSIASHAILTGTSIGISHFPDDADNGIALLRRTDMDLY